MTKNTNSGTTINGLPVTEVTRAGDWVIPVVKQDGTTVYALQINKTQADKDNIAETLKAYADANIEVMTYKGKGDKPVLLVDATQKLKASRTSASTEDMIAEMVALGVPEEVARQAVANAKAKAKAKKQAQ